MILELTPEEVAIVLEALEIARDELTQDGPMFDNNLARDIKWIEYKIEQVIQ